MPFLAKCHYSLPKNDNDSGHLQKPFELLLLDGFNQVRTSPLGEASLSRGSIQGMENFTNDIVKKDGIYLMW